MTRFSNSLFIVCAALALSCIALRAEDAPPVAPKAPDAQKAPDAGKTQKDRTQGRTQGGRGNWTPGGAMGGMGGLDQVIGNVMGGRGTSGVTGMISRMLGIDIEDPKAAPKLDQLPLGANKRMVTQIPIGGVDNFNPTGAGWKMETVFTLTPEQTKSTETLREEYATEQKKLDQEIKDAEAALAAKVTDLRSKYEKKANEILTGTDKESKQKMDALAAEVYKKNAATVAETLPLYDTKDFQQGFAMVKALREKTGATVKDAETQLLTYIPDANRPKFADIIKMQAEARDRQTQAGAAFGGGFQRRGQNGAPGGDAQAVKPPRAPEGDKF